MPFTSVWGRARVLGRHKSSATIPLAQAKAVCCELLPPVFLFKLWTCVRIGTFGAESGAPRILTECVLCSFICVRRSGPTRTCQRPARDGHGVFRLSPSVLLPLCYYPCFFLKNVLIPYCRLSSISHKNGSDCLPANVEHHVDLLRRGALLNLDELPEQTT